METQTRSDLLARAAALSAATLHEAAGGIGALPSGLKPIDPARRLAGFAVTVAVAPGDNLWLHRALVAAGPGDVLVAEAGGRAEHGYFGEIMAVAAMARGIAGLVIDAGVRDADRIQALGFPVFARALCIRGTAKDPHAPGAIGAPVRIGEVIVNAGDLVVGDRDGLVAIPAGRIADVLDAAEARDRREAEIMARLRAGATTMELFGLR